MFLGVRAHHDAKRVSSFETAKAALDRASRTPTGKARKEQLYGFHLGLNRNHGVTWVREKEDGAIAFRLYDTDVVTWLPDNSVEVDNFGTVTTSGFAHTFLPRGVHLHYPTERRGESGGHKTIGFHSGVDRMICIGNVVRFVEQDGCWVADEATCDDIKLPVGLDRKKAADMAKHYNLRDFEIYLSMAPAHLQGENRIEHDCWDLGLCMEALEARDFRRAVECLPLVTEPSGFGTAERMKPLPIVTGSRSSHVTMGSFTKLKLTMWDEHGLLETEVRRTWERKAFDRGMTRIKQMAALGLTVYDLGPD